MAKKLDLIHQTFGKLLVIREAELEERTQPRARSWICQCECGNMTQVTTTHLTSGHTKSCGCYKNSGDYNKNRRQDFTGQKFGRFTILKDVESKNGKRRVECECECGTVKIVGLSDLKAGKVQSCGCLRNERAKEASKKLKVSKPTFKIDLTGKIFGYLTVIEFDSETTLMKKTPENSRSYWKCICKCGNIISVAGTSLTTGHTKSCGCLVSEKASENIIVNQANGVKKNTADLKGQRFDKLLVLEIDSELSGKGKGSFWICQCDCGVIKSIPYSCLVNGYTHSCGCLKMSVGEYHIDKILTENNIPYQREIKFEDLKDKDYLRFDFGIFQNNKLVLLIEYDGRQHFDSTSRWHNESIVLHDKMKDDYCKQNNIPLLRIPYTMSREDISINFILSHIYL